MSALPLDALRPRDAAGARLLARIEGRRRIVRLHAFDVAVPDLGRTFTILAQYDFDADSWLYWRGMEDVPAAYHKAIFLLLHAEDPFAD